MAQKDLKRLIAYSSVSHINFVLLGMAACSPQSITGAVFQMWGHGIVSPMLFLLVGVIYDRAHTRDIEGFGGLATFMPEYTGLTGLAFFASLGLPGLVGFVGEILILLGTFQKNFLAAILASIGIILGAAYMLWLYKRVIFGKLEKKELSNLKDLNLTEGLILFLLAGLTLFLGFYPNLILDTIHVSVDQLINNYQNDLILNTIK